jgi:hypothetical protein
MRLEGIGRHNALREHTSLRNFEKLSHLILAWTRRGIACRPANASKSSALRCLSRRAHGTFGRRHLRPDDRGGRAVFERQNRLLPDGVAPRVTLQQRELLIRVLSEAPQARFRTEDLTASLNGGLLA